VGSKRSAAHLGEETGGLERSRSAICERPVVSVWPAPREAEPSTAAAIPSTRPFISPPAVPTLPITDATSSPACRICSTCAVTRSVA